MSDNPKWYGPQKVDAVGEKRGIYRKRHLIFSVLIFYYWFRFVKKNSPKQHALFYLIFIECVPDIELYQRTELECLQVFRRLTRISS